MKPLSVIIVLLIFFGIKAEAKTYTLQSPGGDVVVHVSTDKLISYSVQYKGSILLRPSTISLDVGNGHVIGLNPWIKKASKTSVQQIIYPSVKEKRAEIPDNFNQLSLKLDNHFEIRFRAYDDGVAYRFVSEVESEITITDEVAEFHFIQGTQVYYGQVSKQQDADIFHTDRKSVV